MSNGRSMYTRLAADYDELTKDTPFRPCPKYPDCRCGRRTPAELLGQEFPPGTSPAEMLRPNKNNGDIA